MASRARTTVLLASIAPLVVAAVALVGPLTATAAARGCGRPGGAGLQKLSLAQAQRSIGCLLNRTRRRHGLDRLHMSGRLERAAQRHTSYMKRHRCFSHRCPGEPSLVSRLERVDYLVDGLRRWRVGENIAWGTGSLGNPKAIVKGWMHSPGHRANILDPQFRQLGVGFARGHRPGSRSMSGTYTTDFGMRKG